MHKFHSHFFLFPEGQMHQSQPDCLCYRFVEIIFKMKTNKLVTKYMDILTYNFAHTINLKRSVMRLKIKLRDLTLRFVQQIHIRKKCIYNVFHE